MHGVNTRVKLHRAFILEALSWAFLRGLALYKDKTYEEKRWG